jgi:hypothetical protein
VRTPGGQPVKRISFECDGDFLTLVLPSKRAIRYPFPRLERNRYDEPCVVFKDTALTAPGRWGDCNFGHGAYGGLWTENIVQGIARDLLAGAMQRLEAAGYAIVLTVHDEIAAEAPIGSGSLEEFKRLLIAAPAWAEGLPIAAKVRESPRFNMPAEGAPVAAADDAAGDTADHDDIAGVEDISGANFPEKAPEIPGAAADIVTTEPAAAAGPAEVRTEPEPIPFAFTFDQIRAAFEQPRDEKRGGNGHDYDYARNGDGYPHGENDISAEAAFYTYRHADGSPYLGVRRTSTKQFPQFHWASAAWVKGAPAGAKIPYRLPELIKAPLDAWVLICAGEKDADNAAALGFVATTNPEGERKGAWVAELNAWFAGRKRVAIMEDNDETGRAHALEVANALRGVGADIRIVHFRELAEHGDLSD